MFRRLTARRAPIDHAALEANCVAVVSELAEDFDWRLTDRCAFARTVAARVAGLLADDPRAAGDLPALRRTIEREACAAYFAALYDGLRAGGRAREDALEALFRPELVEGEDGPRTVYRGYLYRAALFQVHRWTGRAGWTPDAETAEELARAAAEDVLLALLRGVELREGGRAFWAYAGRAVERRTIDQLRALGRRPAALSLDAITEARGGDLDAGGATLAVGDLMETARTGDVARLMDAARLSPEERYALLAGAYGLNDGEAAADLGRRLGRSVGPPDIRRWRFRGRDKLRRVAEAEARADLGR